MSTSTWIAHHGILGQKWGVRRFQNANGTLTPEGRKRYQNSDGSLNESAEKHIRDNLWGGNTGQDSERNKLGAKMNAELQSTKEAKAYNDLVKRRGIHIKDEHGNIIKTNLSYLSDDWSNPDKVFDEMIKDMQIEDAYHKKDVEITNKHMMDWAGALLKDLGYEDTQAGRDFLIKKGIISEYS